ncbi:MAG: hypothetical protein M3Z54_05800 [Gemmatimonadota bacterium]|nr:hypothetical protein [Gemmatimonadota bacterium]
MKRAILFTIALAACSGTTEPPAVDLSLAVHIPTPAIYVQWWSEVEACSGLKGDASAVAFYQAPGYDFVINGSSYWGFWTAKDNKIVLADAHMADKKLVWHEEMHALLKRSDHPPEYFKGACGDLTYPGGE